MLSRIDFLKGTFTLITGTALGGRGAALRTLTAPSFVPYPHPDTYYLVRNTVHVFGR